MKFVLDGVGALMVLVGLLWVAFAGMSALGSGRTGPEILVALTVISPGVGVFLTGLALLGLSSILDRLDGIRDEAKRGADALEVMRNRSEG